MSQIYTLKTVALACLLLAACSIAHADFDAKYKAYSGDLDGNGYNDLFLSRAPDLEQPIIVVEKIVTDLQRSLPIVVSKVSLNDLIAVENEEPTGAAVIVIRSFGENYAASVDVSDFTEN